MDRIRRKSHVRSRSNSPESFKFCFPLSTACDGVVQHDGDMQQNSCGVELHGFLVELDGRGFKSCARVRRIIYGLRALDHGVKGGILICSGRYANLDDMAIERYLQFG